jgi:HemY protein
MIRLALFVIVLGLAMLLGPVLANHPGYVMIVVAGVTIEATFVGLILVLLGAGVAWWGLWWLLKRLFHLPRISFSFLRSRKERRARQALQQGILAFARQDWQNAHQLFEIAKSEPLWDKARLTMASYSALRAGDFAKANQRAAELDPDDTDSSLLLADLWLAQGDALKAVTVLAPKIAAEPKNQSLGRCYMAALQQAGQWQSLLEQVPLALKHSWFSKNQWVQYRYQLYPQAISALAQQGLFDEHASYWQNLNAKERKSVAATLGKVWAKAVSGQAEPAEKLLLETLALADLPLAWNVIQQIPLGRSVLQLRKQIQHWLRDHSNNAYLYAMLSYCATQEGEAEQAAASWQKALQYQPDLLAIGSQA